MEQNTPLSTNQLFHYTPKKEWLLNIIQNGFKPRYSLEKLGLFDNNNNIDLLEDLLDMKPESQEQLTDEFGIPMTSFCDIHLDLVSNHAKIYGKYALGLTKQWGEVQNITPVFYVPVESNSRFYI